MILTGKTLRDFKKWFFENYKNDWNYYQTRPILLNTLIIEWLDSVNIYIWIIPSKRVETKFTFSVFKNLFSHESAIFNYDNRSIATKEAIIKANEIYNSL